MAVNGKGATAEPATAEFSIIPHDKLRGLYANLLKAELVAARKRGPAAKSDPGWDAVAAAGPGVFLDLTAEDVVVVGAKSPLLDALTPRPSRRSGRAGKVPVPVAKETRLPELIGKALAIKTQKTGRVAVAFWPDPDEQPWLDVLEIARTHALPVVCVCPPLSDASVAELARTVGKPGTELPRITVDGYDPVAVYRVAHESIDRARRDRGATLVECARFRVQGIRGRIDPVMHMERYLKAKGLLSRDLQHRAAEQAVLELQAGKRAG